MRETLILTRKDVEALLDMKEAIGAVELAFKEKGLGRAQMPAKIYLFYEKYGGDLRSMPSYLENLDVSAVKVVNVHPQNPEKYGLPTVMAVLILIEPATGFPLTIMDATYLTDMRTGAAGAVAAKYLARRDVKTVALIGSGRQARTQLLGLVTLYGGLESVKVYSISKESREAFVDEAIKKYPSVKEIRAVGTAEEAVRGADIVVTVTPSRSPIVMSNWIKEGVHINAIGADAPGKEELDPAILKRAKIVVDDWEQASHSGEINVPLSKGLLTKQDVYGEIGQVVAGLKPGRTSNEEITVFCSTGLAVQDAVTAKLVYDKAKSRNLGVWMQLVL
ncbi:MAG: alanine dehydrogenase [Candidatus Nezhaarchaeales archaeon]